MKADIKNYNSDKKTRQLATIIDSNVWKSLWPSIAAEACRKTLSRRAKLVSQEELGWGRVCEALDNEISSYVSKEIHFGVKAQQFYPLYLLLIYVFTIKHTLEMRSGECQPNYLTWISIASISILDSVFFSLKIIIVVKNINTIYHFLTTVDHVF